MFFDNPYIVWAFIPISLALFYLARPLNPGKTLLVVSRTLLVILMLLALAGPHSFELELVEEENPSLTIIADQTQSMELYPPGVASEIYTAFKDRTPVDIQYLKGDSTRLGDAVVQASRKHGNILLVTDGNSNQGKDLVDAVNLAASLNTTIFALKPIPLRKDLGVALEGNKKVIQNSKASFTALVSQVGDTGGDLKVTIDGTVVVSKKITGSEKIPFTYTFKTTGSHKIIAKITPSGEDLFPENNVYYKSVYVVPKPRVLLVPNSVSPLSQVLRSLYQLETSNKLQNLENYGAVVLDDPAPEDLSEGEIEELADYLINTGGGLVVVGGDRAYTNYKPEFESMLPVISGGGSPQSKTTAIVIVVDASGSVGHRSGGTQKISVEKALAIQIVDQISPRDYIGVLAFHNHVITVTPLSRGKSKNTIEKQIAGIRHGGQTYLLPALKEAGRLLKNFRGKGSIIIISDGRLTQASQQEGQVINEARRLLNDQGITTYTIGVGSDTNTGFMKRLARNGGGIYFQANEAKKFKLLFGEPEEKKEKKGNGYPLVILDSNHFITQGLELDAKVYGYDPVTPKNIAQPLVMTENGKPILTVWRFGLGRVAALTTDNGGSWSGALYTKPSSRLIASTINWAIGDPERASQLKIEAADTTTQSPIDLQVTAKRKPGLAIDGKPITLSQTGEKTYQATLPPGSPGFRDISGYLVAVNYPAELEKLGWNPLLEELTTATGGKTYTTLESLKNELLQDLKARSIRTEKTRKDKRYMFLEIAIILLLAEVAVRRINEIRRGKRKEKEEKTRKRPERKREETRGYA